MLVGLLVGLADVADGKVLRGVIKLSGELPEAYISKFSINEEGYIEGALKTVNGHPFNTGFVPESPERIACCVIRERANRLRLF